jgi:hypothetical protein
LKRTFVCMSGSSLIDAKSLQESVVLVSDILRAMKERTAQSSRFLQVVVCVWMLVAQIWYYAQFKEQFRPILSSALR